MYKFDPIKTTESAKLLFKEERAINHLEGWFIVKEIPRKIQRTSAYAKSRGKISRSS